MTSPPAARLPSNFDPNHMAGQNLTGMARITAAFFNSLKGYQAAFQSEEAFRQEVYLLIVAAPLGLWLGETPIERILLVGSVLLVWIVELLNTGIEVVVDRISFERHELSGKAKDIGSAAVLTALFLAGMTWLMILIPHFA
jgi:diacylglycerol kinase (ATP)